MNLHAKLARARGARQALARRTDRRRKIRRDVPGAGAEDRRACISSALPTCRRPTREPISRASAGSPNGPPRRRWTRRSPKGTRTSVTTGRRWSRIRRSTSSSNAPDNPIGGGRALPWRVSQRQARRQCHRRSRCVLRTAAGAQGGRSGRRLQPRLRRPAGADLRSRRLGAGRRLQRRRRRPRPQVAAAFRAVDAGNGVGLLRPDAGTGARRRTESENVQFVPRRIEAGDREHRRLQRDRARQRRSGPDVSAGERSTTFPS